MIFHAHQWMIDDADLIVLANVVDAIRRSVSAKGMT